MNSLLTTIVLFSAVFASAQETACLPCFIGKSIQDADVETFPSELDNEIDGWNYEIKSGDATANIKLIPRVPNKKK